MDKITINEMEEKILSELIDGKPDFSKFSDRVSLLNNLKKS